MEHRNRHATIAAMILGLLAAAFSPTGAEAQDQKVYRWVDEDGNVHYTCLLYTSPSPRDED